MKKSWLFKTFLTIAYCIPFAFLAVHADAASGTLLFYGIMAVGLAALCWAAVKTDTIAIACLGNVLSVGSSYIAAWLSGLEPMGHYFKPFTSYSLMAAVSVLAIALQAAAVGICARKKKR